MGCAAWSWTNDDSSDTGAIVLISDIVRLQAVLDNAAATGQLPTIDSDLVLYKRRKHSGDSSFIQYIDLQDGNRMKTWTSTGGDEEDLEINYDARTNGTSIRCRTKSGGGCSPLVDGVRSVLLIKVQFNPRQGYAPGGNEWSSNAFTMTGSHYDIGEW